MKITIIIEVDEEAEPVARPSFGLPHVAVRAMGHASRVLGQALHHRRDHFSRKIMMHRTGGISMLPSAISNATPIGVMTVLIERA